MMSSTSKKKPAPIIDNDSCDNDNELSDELSELNKSSTPNRDYRENIAYKNTLLEFLTLVGMAINKGESGLQELETFWMYCLPEIRNDINEEMRDQKQELDNILSEIPDGLIHFNNDQWEPVQSNPAFNVDDFIVSRDPLRMQHIHARQSSDVRKEYIVEYVKSIIPVIVECLSKYNLLMQTRRGVQTRTFSRKDIVEKSIVVGGENND